MSRGALIHPHSTISTVAGAVTIGEDSLISEHCQIGNTANSSSGRPLDDNPSNDVRLELDIEKGEVVKIASRVYLAPSVVIEAPCSIEDDVQIESNVKISRECVVRSHSKICAGVTLPPGTEVSAWTVVYGANGSGRRRTMNNDDGQRHEKQRLKGLDAMKVNDLQTLKRAAAAKAPLTKPESAARVRVK